MEEPAGEGPEASNGRDAIENPGLSLADAPEGGPTVPVQLSLRTLRIRTRCQDCTARCCTQPHDWVYITDREVERLERKSGRSRATFVTEFVNTQKGLRFKVLLLPCPFLETGTNRCTAYEYRPLVCRLFPLYAEPLTNRTYLVSATCDDLLENDEDRESAGWSLDEFDEELAIWLGEFWNEAQLAQ